ncbi:hypothetical protein CR152_27960 [Massilia violaceinigra]|uniref:Lysis protein n=1 Tax=Massilia violaceinigra TaxID=2045208 RepID=A0A2D2DSF1_9BURK|nr:hypothetical protein [Massilia violaceinigra]ATQ77911.1 hypothetical protein CR152_27960 [Massilia violaceinigra]
MIPLAAVSTAWKIGAALTVAAAVVAGAAAYRSHVWHVGYDSAVSVRAELDLRATLARQKENAMLASKQTTINAGITKAKNEELAPVATVIATRRVRVGDAICSGPATPTKAESASGGNRADPPGRLVSESVERDFRALTLAVEQDLATGRACQAFIERHGLVP